MKTKLAAYPKPKDAPRPRNDFTKDGRLIESGYQYSRTKLAMWERQGGLCKCGKYMPTIAHGHRHHLDGRGLGGGKRDDRKTVLICIDCHAAHHDPVKAMAFRRSQ